MLRATLATGFLFILPVAEAEPASVPWSVRMRRIEGAAVDARRAAEDLQETAKKVHDSRYLSDMAILRSQLDKLERMVLSARMAVDVSAENFAQRN